MAISHPAENCVDSECPAHPTIPIRQKSASGEPKPTTNIERTCRRCGAAFLGLAPGKTGERGIWVQMTWFCSQECHDTKGGWL